MNAEHQLDAEDVALALQIAQELFGNFYVGRLAAGKTVTDDELEAFVEGAERAILFTIVNERGVE